MQEPVQTPRRVIHPRHRRPGWQVRSIWQTHKSHSAVSTKLFITADRLLCSHRTVKCTKHNWKLNVSTMNYVNPPDSFLQDELGKSCHYLYLGWRILLTTGLESFFDISVARGRAQVWMCMTTVWSWPPKQGQLSTGIAAAGRCIKWHSYIVKKYSCTPNSVCHCLNKDTPC